MQLRRSEELRYMARRSREAVLLAALVGGATGFGVAIFEQVTVEMVLHSIESLPWWVKAGVPLVGLAMTALMLRVAGRVSPATADEYIRNFHEYDDLGIRHAPLRMLGALTTLGAGAPLGLEGPSIYLGASLGTLAQSRFRKLFGAGENKALMVAGAAAGVAAIFKAPATGAVFALEVPYQDDVGRRLLLPALVGAGSGYLAFVAVNDTVPLLQVGGAAPFDLRDLLGALLLGVGTGLVTRVFSWMLVSAKKFQRTVAPVRAVLAGGLLLALLQVAGYQLFDEDLALSPGYNVIEWIAEPQRSLWLLAALLAIRCLGVTAAIGAGGVGGLFVPLVVLGAVTGRFAGGLLDAPNLSLFTIIGIAAALGAGYRVPLASVMFVAEATGRAGFVVPGLFAAVGADLVMGTKSVTPYQQRSDTVSEYH